MHQSWRNALEWEKCGLKLSTVSDSACKLYDAAISQYVGWYEDPAFGGLEKTLEDLKTSDPNFVMGHVVNVGLDLIGTGRTAKLDPAFAEEIDKMVKLTNTQYNNLNEREIQHVDALKLFSEGELIAATETWEAILKDYPTDMLALKLAYDTYFYLGEAIKLRDSVIGVYHKWKETDPLYSYLHGMYSFGLVETDCFKEAEKMALRGLELNSKDGWATHGLAHVYEMQGRPDEGISFLNKTSQNWETCGLLACHNYWHLALYHIEKMEYEVALDIFDEQMAKRFTSGAMLDIVDGASLLYRLAMEGVDVKERWHLLTEICLPHINDHILAFNDMHLMMVLLGAENDSACSALLNSLSTFMENSNSTNHKVCSEIGLKVIKALKAAKEERHSHVVNLLYPIRSSLSKIGGSNAQRDVLQLLLINSAFRSMDPQHKQLAMKLLYEREHKKDTCTLRQRLQSQISIP